jgi:hypothetical protein
VQELHDEEEDPPHRACPNSRRVPAAVSSTGWGKWHSLTDTARRNGRVACSSRCVACCCASCWRLKAWSVEKRWGPLVLCTTTRRSPGLFGGCPPNKFVAAATARPLRATAGRCNQWPLATAKKGTADQPHASKPFTTSGPACTGRNDSSVLTVLLKTRSCQSISNQNSKALVRLSLFSIPISLFGSYKYYKSSGSSILLIHSLGPSEGSSFLCRPSTEHLHQSKGMDEE